MNPIDTDYSAYVNAVYLIAIGALLAVCAWSVFRLTNARRKLSEAEASEREASGKGGQ